MLTIITIEKRSPSVMCFNAWRPFFDAKKHLSIVPLAGVEPVRPCGHSDLNAARLPIPPQRQQHS